MNIKQILQQIQSKRPYLIGICGIPGAGKSTLAAQLKQSLKNALIIPLDGYHLYRKDLDENGLLFRGAAFTFDLIKFEKQIKRIYENPIFPLCFPSFDHAEKDPKQNNIMLTQQIEHVIVQGLYVFTNNQIKWDMKIFVNCQINISMQRVAKYKQINIEDIYNVVLKNNGSRVLNEQIEMTEKMLSLFQKIQIYRTQFKQIIDINIYQMNNYQYCFEIQNKNRYYKKISVQKCLPNSSNSFVIAISNDIVKQFPFEFKPINDLQYIKQNKQSKQYVQLWNFYIIKQILKGKAVKWEDTILINILVNEKLQQKIMQNKNFMLHNNQQYNETQINQFQSNFRKTYSIFELSNKNIIKQLDNKIGIYAMHPYKQQGYPFKPQINMEALFIGNLYQNQKWSIFNFQQHQIPSLQIILTFNTIIITGSKLDVPDKTQQIIQATNNLIKALQLNKQLKVLGICYGHQLISDYYKVPVVKKQTIGKIQNINFKKDIIQKYNFLQKIKDKNVMKLYEHHSYFVQQVPQQFELLGDSQSCKVQSLIRKDGRIFTNQFHSQFFVQHIQKYQKLINQYQNSNINEFYKFVSQQLQQQNLQDSLIILECYKQYLAK